MPLFNFIIIIIIIIIGICCVKLDRFFKSCWCVLFDQKIIFNFQYSTSVIQNAEPLGMGVTLALINGDQCVMCDRIRADDYLPVHAIIERGGGH
jgi:hypothetical protein